MQWSCDLQPTDTTGDILARTARRYRRCHRFARHYVAAKLRLDPMHRDILALARAEGFGSVLDVGCGFGQMGIALLEAGSARMVIGIDRAASHLHAAATAAQGLAFQPAPRDLGQDAPLPAADTILLLDVLYQLPPPAQQALVQRIAQAAGSRILVRMLDTERGLRSSAGRALERGFRRIWPTAGAVVQPGPPAQLAALLREHGFRVTLADCARGTPFANVLLHAQRITTPPACAAP